MNIIRLNVFASSEEIAYIKHCRDAPVMAFTNPNYAQDGEPFIPFAEEPIKVVHRYALAHGLPEFPGYYGIDLETGEFVREASGGGK